MSIEGQARMIPSARGTRGDEGKHLGAPRSVWTLVDKAGVCCEKQDKKDSQHWIWGLGSGQEHPQTQSI